METAGRAVPHGIVDPKVAISAARTPLGNARAGEISVFAPA
jgi:hypothetical protein